MAEAPDMLVEVNVTHIEAEAAVRAAAGMIVDAVLDLLQADPHLWSIRPCSTCGPISALVGKPFGCLKYAIDRRGEQ